MFTRKSETYAITPESIRNILRDDANPLNRISHIVTDGARILDIGAGNGLLSQVLQNAHAGLTIDGIEPDPYAAEIARKHYRHFYCGCAQNFKEKILDRQYDYIVLADVIEHMNDPYGFLLEISAGLPENTKIILSVPNVAFGAVRISLLRGRFDYCDSGILEKTHVRFFTLDLVEKLVANIGMNIDKLYFLQRRLFSTEIKVQRFGLNFCCMHSIARDRLASTYQFLLVLSKNDTATEVKYFGKRTVFPLFEFVVAKLKE